MGDRTIINPLPYDADSPLLEAALAVFAHVWPDRDPAEARESFPRYARYQDFRGLVALHDDMPVGMGYGARSYPGVPWHDLVAARLGEDHPALLDAWRLVELAVVPEAQGLGIGVQLHDALLAAQPCPQALVCTRVHNQHARSMYERRGWVYVEESFYVVEEDDTFVIMCRRCG